MTERSRPVKRVLLFALVLASVLTACTTTEPATTTVISGPDGGSTGNGEASPPEPSDPVSGASDTTVPDTTVPDEPAPEPVRVSFADLGRDHLSDEDSVAILEGRLDPPEYNSVPPTSGSHAQGWALCGIYRQQVPDIIQVHSLEHGAVMIQYLPEIDPEDVLTLESFGRQLGSHFVVSPNDGLTSPIVLTAWTVMLELQVLDLDVIDEFWADFANQGPEQVDCPLEVDEAF